MPKFTQDRKTGKLTGSIGDGKTRVPKAAPTLPVSVSTSQRLSRPELIQEEINFGTLTYSGDERTGLTLEEARIAVASDLDHGIVSNVVRYLPSGNIDENFDDEVEVVADKLSRATQRIETLVKGIEEILAEHFPSRLDDNESLYCQKCHTKYPCDDRKRLEELLASVK